MGKRIRGVVERRRSRRSRGVGLALVVLLAGSGSAQAAKLGVYGPNPHYFKDQNGNPVYLVGYYGSFPHRVKPYDYQQFLDWNAANKVNYVRITAEGFDIPVSSGRTLLQPYTKDASGQFNLTQWNPEFWTRTRSFIAAARTKGVYVHITIFNNICYKNKSNDIDWSKCLWNPAKNVNDALLGNIDRNGDGDAVDRLDANSNGNTVDPGEYSEFYDHEALQGAIPSGHPQRTSRLTLASYQRNFVTKVLDETSGYDNVFYELGNELLGTSQWHQYWITYVRNYFQTRGLVANLLTIDDGNSPLNILTTANVAGAFWHSAQVVNDPLLASERIVTVSKPPTGGLAAAYTNYSKIMGVDNDGTSFSDPTVAARDNRRGAWIAFTNGWHWLNYDVDGGVEFDLSLYNHETAGYFKHLMSFIQTRAIPFTTMSPRKDLLKVDGVQGAGHLLARLTAGQEQYVAYTSGGGTVSLNLTGLGGSFSGIWYNPITGLTGPSVTLSGGGWRSASPPSTWAEAVLHLKR